MNEEIKEEDLEKIKEFVSEEAMNKIWRNILIYARKEFVTTSGRKFFYNNCGGNNNTIFIMTKNKRKFYFTKDTFKKVIELRKLPRAKTAKVIPGNLEIRAIITDPRIQVEEILNENHKNSPHF